MLVHIVQYTMYYILHMYCILYMYYIYIKVFTKNLKYWYL